MNFPEKTIVAGPRSFVSEKDLEDRRKKRQEEWEKTRKPDDPDGELMSDQLLNDCSLTRHAIRFLV